MRAPQMWNLNSGLLREGPAAGTLTGVLDTGFAPAHADLVFEQNQSPGVEADHGTHVAGIIGASFDNGIGIDGINPFARLVVRASAAGTAYGLFEFLDARPELRVVNISLGYNWYKAGIDPNESLAAQTKTAIHGSIVALGLSLRTGVPLLVVSAGNDSDFASGRYVDAKWNSPFTHAGLVLGRSEILAVESLENFAEFAVGVLGSNFSNINGTISAPGSHVLSTYHSAAYETCSGTSMAAPHVAGLAGYLLALDPSLGNAELRELLLATSVPVESPTAPRIDAFAAALALDSLRDNDRVLRMLVDIDDGTLDGNRRADADGNVYTADARGDGQVDMRDFRRWRDWLLQVEDPEWLELDGGAAHPKKDLNGDGVVGTPAEENVYPRGDFNGDGRISRTAKRAVPGFAQPVTDLEVLQKLFDDPHYTAAELPGLINSGDLEIDATRCLGTGVAEVESSIRVRGAAAPLQTRTHGPGAVHQVYTAPTNPADPAGYTARIEARDAGGALLGSAERDVEVGLGSDTFWRPSCGSLVVEITFPDTVQAGTPTPLLVRVGRPALDGFVAYGPGYQVTLEVSAGTLVPEFGITDADGYV